MRVERDNKKMGYHRYNRITLFNRLCNDRADDA